MDDVIGMIDEVQEMVQAFRSTFLATVIWVNGSAYRKEGAMMVVQPDGFHTGMLTAGFLEADIAERVRKMENDGGSVLVTYDLRAEDDLSWGRGPGCDGVIDVLIEAVDDVLLKDLLQLKSFLEQGEPVFLIRKLGRGNWNTECLSEDALNVIQAYLFCSEEGQTFGRWNRCTNELADDLLARFHEMASRQTGSRSQNALLLSDFGEASAHYLSLEDEVYFVQRFLPQPRLFTSVLAQTCGHSLPVRQVLVFR